MTLGFGAYQPLTHYVAAHQTEDADLYVIPSEHETQGAYHEHDGPGSDTETTDWPGCWRLDEWGYDSIVNDVTIESCSRISGTYAVFAASGNDPCTVSGTYRIEERLTGPESEAEADLSVSLSLSPMDG